MVDKDGGYLAPLAKEETLVLPNKPSDWGLQLIDRDALTWLGHRS
jgi:hypothetical protein